MADFLGAKQFGVRPGIINKCDYILTQCPLLTRSLTFLLVVTTIEGRILTELLPSSSGCWHWSVHLN